LFRHRSEERKAPTSGYKRNMNEGGGRWKIYVFTVAQKEKKLEKCRVEEKRLIQMNGAERLTDIPLLKTIKL